MALSLPMGEVGALHTVWVQVTCVLKSLWRKGPFSFLDLFLVSWSWQGKVLSLRYPLQGQLARSSKKTTYLHVYLHKSVWTSWPVTFPSSRRGIKKKFHIISLRVNHKLQNADLNFFFLKSISSFYLDVWYFFCVFSGPFWVFSFPLYVFALHFPPPSSLMLHDRVFANGFSFWISMRLKWVNSLGETKSHCILFPDVGGRSFDACSKQQM